MNEPYYLTDKIFIQNNKYFYDNQPIKNHNWHHLLKEYGWEKLNKFWIKKLNKLSGLKCNNSLFGVLECGSNGDCLFNCISYAINQVDITDSKTLRESLSESIDNDIEKLANNIGIECFRGNSLNVLDRYYNCAKYFDIYTFVRISGDAPLIDPIIVDKTIEYYKTIK